MIKQKFEVTSMTAESLAELKEKVIGHVALFHGKWCSIVKIGKVIEFDYFQLSDKSFQVQIRSEPALSVSAGHNGGLYYRFEAKIMAQPHDYMQDFTFEHDVQMLIIID